MAIKPLNSVAGFSVGETPANIILANGDITTNNITTTGVANLNNISNVTILGGTSGQVIQTDGSGVLSFVTIDTWRIQNGTSNVQVAPANGNVTVTVAGNANIATFTSTGANISGYLTIDGNVTANGNISANNYLVTPTAKDLIIAPSTNLVRIDGNANPYNDATYSLGNNLARWANVYSKEANVSGNANVGSLRTDNLLYANGQPWDLQEAAGSNTQIQFNNGSNNFGASANLTFDDATQVLEVTGNITVSDTANVGNLRTDNLLYANGQPWDLQQAAGTNTQIQFNSGDNFAASANLTFDDATQAFYVNGTISSTGNANVGNLGTAGLITATGNVTAGNISTAGVVTAIGNIDGGNLNTAGLVSAVGNVIGGNISTDGVVTAIGNITGGNVNTAGLVSAVGNVIGGNISTAGVVTAIGNIDGGNLNTGGVLSVTGNATVGNLSTGGLITAIGNITGGNLTTSGLASVTGNVIAGNVETAGNVVANVITANTTVDAGNLNVINNVTSSLIPDVTNTYDLGNSTTTWGTVYAANFVGNISGNIAAPGSNTEIIFNDSGIANAVTNFTYDKAYNAGAGSLNVGNTAGGRIITDDLYVAYANVNGNIDTSGNINAIGNISGNDITASGNITTTGSGGDITMTGGDITGVNDISANSANFAGNVTTNNLTVNLTVSGNTANFTGNIAALNANLGNLATANYVNVANDINIVGNVNAGNLVGPLANGTSNIKIYQDSNVEISIGGNANVATFSATGLYVDGEINTTQGNILSNGNVTANGFLNGGNAVITGEVDAGSVKTANISAPVGNITISAIGSDSSILLVATGNGTIDAGTKRITSLANPVSDQDAATKIYVDEVAQGLDVKASVAYATTAALPAYTYNNGASGVGATITANANGALSIDGGSPSVGDRVLIKNEIGGNQPYNGIYVVTNAGSASAAFVLTRATDFDNSSPSGEIPGAFTFVEDGSTNADSGWVCVTNSPVTVGTTPITFTQFSGAGTYTGSDGINITGTLITANVDNDTTAIVGGNIVVKASANLTTPNVGDATFSSLTWNNLSNGNVTANNLSTANIANIGLHLTVGGLAQVDGNISSNNWVNANNAFITNNLSAQGNVLAGNITANATVFAANANVTGTSVTNYLTVNNAISGNTANFSGSAVVAELTVNNAITGNTANFSGNVVLPNLTVNLDLAGNTANFTGAVAVDSLTVTNNLAGNTANFTGNIESLNANLGNLVTANYFTGTLINGTSNIAIPAANGNIEFTSGGNLTLAITPTGANITGDLDVTGNFNVGSLEATNVKATTAVLVGDTTVTWANVTTTSVSANQTISSFTLTSNITGVEWLVKGIDSTGNKYSVATVQAVTDGTNVDFTTYGTVQLGGYTGSLAVNVVGSTIRLQVTPASSNSTVWTTQYRLI